MARISNIRARAFVQAKEPFTGANMLGVRQNGMYVVYSYGRHWPLFIFSFANGQWYENSEKYSSTTSKHRGQAHPHKDTMPLTCQEMLKLAENREPVNFSVAVN